MRRSISQLTTKFWPSYLFVALFACASISENELDKDKLVFDVVFQSLQNQHFAPQNINDDFSKKAFAQYLKNLDAGKRFLLQSDADELRKYEMDIDDEIKSGNSKLMKDAEERLAKRIQEVSLFYGKLLDTPFDFTTNERIDLEFEKKVFPKSEAERREEWRKYLKYQTMIQLMTKLQAGIKTFTVDSVKVKLTPALEKQARESVRKQTKDFFKRLSQINQSDRMSEFVNSLTHMYDPHTDYYVPANKENFDIQLSGELEGIGATLTQKDGFIAVSAIVPGSASWKQGQLKENDLILKVAQDVDEPVDVTDMRLDDAIKLIRGKKGTKVVLTVKKTDGTLHTIPIVRDKVIIQDTYAKSTVIKGDDGSKIGYIYLPSFYVNFNDANGRRCSKDVRDEIVKLKGQGASSIIFDLRNNGGGSLSDVVSIVGFFIDRGPVVQVKTRQGGVNSQSDNESGVLFDGPLVVLQNSFSASASEIFAAAIQDYNRGLIMGSVHSFGKGTVQQVMDLDQIVPMSYSRFKPLGSLKLTTQKFYRINGGATQLKGVSSDLEVPDIYKHIKFGEKELDNTLQWDQVAAANYQPLSSYNARFPKAIDNAKLRINSNPLFAAIEKSALKLKARQDDESITLNLLEYAREVQNNSVEDKAFKKLIEGQPKLNIVPNSASTIETGDTLKVTSRKKFETDVAKDATLAEAVRVIGDLK